MKLIWLPHQRPPWISQPMGHAVRLYCITLFCTCQFSQCEIHYLYIYWYLAVLTGVRVTHSWSESLREGRDWGWSCELWAGRKFVRVGKGKEEVKAEAAGVEAYWIYLGQQSVKKHKTKKKKQNMKLEGLEGIQFIHIILQVPRQ